MAVPLKTRALWKSLHEFARARGGDVISVENAFPARINCTADSTLPHELAGRRMEIRIPPATFGDLYEFEVRKVDTRKWIEPCAIVEIIDLTARSTGAKRIVHHAGIRSRDEYEVSLKPIREAPNVRR